MVMSATQTLSLVTERYVRHRHLHSFPTRRSSDLTAGAVASLAFGADVPAVDTNAARVLGRVFGVRGRRKSARRDRRLWALDRKSTRLNSSHQISSYAVFCLKKKKLLEKQICKMLI